MKRVGRVAAVSFAAGMLLLAGAPAYAAKYGFIRRLHESHPVLAWIILLAMFGVVGYAAYSVYLSSKKIQEKEELLKKYNGMMQGKRYDAAVRLCKECVIYEDFTKIYRGKLVKHNSEVLAKLLQAVKAAGKVVSPELERIAALFKEQAPKSDKAVVDLSDIHDAFKSALQQAGAGTKMGAGPGPTKS